MLTREATVDVEIVNSEPLEFLVNEVISPIRRQITDSTRWLREIFNYYSDERDREKLNQLSRLTPRMERPIPGSVLRDTN